jgi:hypothetical protein
MKCTKCNAPVRHNTEIEIKKHGLLSGKGAVTPEPGVITICYNCGTIGIFNDQRNIVPATSEELQKLFEADPENLKTLLAVQVWIKVHYIKQN